MAKLIFLTSVLLAFAACASKTKQNSEMLEKYPACYNKNVKLTNRCIELNEGGKSTTALQLENSAYPGQYE